MVTIVYKKRRHYKESQVFNTALKAGYGRLSAKVLAVNSRAIKEPLPGLLSRCVPAMSSTILQFRGRFTAQTSV